MHQNKCSAAEVSSFINAVASAQLPFTSGNPACDACLQTDAAAFKHGPVVSITKNGSLSALINFGGCIATVDTNVAAGSCGNQYNDYQECIAAECNACSDFATHGPDDLACIKAATAAGGRCHLAVPSTACEDEIQGGGGDSVCLSAQGLMNTWCGP
jgi:hypothetical protein